MSLETKGSFVVEGSINLSLADVVKDLDGRYPYVPKKLREIVESKPVERVARAIEWSAPKHAVRIQLAASYFLESIPTTHQLAFWDSLTSAFTLENHFNLIGSIPTTPTKEIVARLPQSKELISKASSAINEGNTTLARAVMSGIWAGGELSGNNLGTDFVEAVAFSTDKPISEVALLIDYDAVETSNTALKMAYRGEGLSLSVGHPNLKPTLFGGSKNKLDILLNRIEEVALS